MNRLLFIGLFVIFYSVTYAQKQEYKVIITAFYNLENFYDTVDNTSINDEEFLPKGAKNYNGGVYWNKVDHLATVISQIGTEVNPDGPAILGCAEIENDTVLTDLVHNSRIKDRDYHFVHYDSKDFRGIDVALLYNPKYFQVLDSRKLYVHLPQGSKDAIFTRDVLWVQGVLAGDTVNVFVNHWPSRRGGEERSAPGRAAAAQVDKNFMDSLRTINPNAKIIVMGDLNDDPVSPAVRKVLKATGDLAKITPDQLYNPWVDMYKRGIGTLAYQDAWGLFDQIMISYAWLDKKQDGFFYYQQHIFNKEFLVENIGKYKGYPMRTWDGNIYRGGYSDHFPTYLVFLKKTDSGVTIDN